jgi:hypothetical protein
MAQDDWRWDVLIDCDTCIVRGTGCSDCVISVLLNSPRPIELDEAEEAVFVTLADAGLVPPLRLISGGSNRIRGIA